MSGSTSRSSSGLVHWLFNCSLSIGTIIAYFFKEVNSRSNISDSMVPRCVPKVNYFLTFIFPKDFIGLSLRHTHLFYSLLGT